MTILLRFCCIFIASLSMLSGCSGTATPESASRGFLNAIAANDIKLAYTYTDGYYTNQELLKFTEILNSYSIAKTRYFRAIDSQSLTQVPHSQQANFAEVLLQCPQCSEYYRHHLIRLEYIDSRWYVIAVLMT